MTSGARRVGPIERRLRACRDAGRPGLIAFANAGDPDLARSAGVLTAIAARADVLELGVPFPDSCTDGETIRRSHARGLAAGADLDAALALARTVRARRATPVVLLLDWSHGVRVGLRAALGAIARAGVAGVLVHGLPPLLHPELVRRTAELDLEAPATLYPASPDATRARALSSARGFVYLVSRWGRTGRQGAAPGLAAALARLQAETDLPIAVGFGVACGEDVTRLHRMGADACVVGSAVAALVERTGGDAAALGDALERSFAPHAAPRHAASGDQRCA